MADDLIADIEMMTRIAALYYLEDRTQGEIAAQLGLSRPKVGRLLKRARADGIVEITVHTHPSLSLGLEQALKQRFGLQTALLVSDQADERTQRAQVARMAAGYLARVLREGMTAAVGMGRNVGALPDHLAGMPPRPCVFVSAIGGSPQVDPPINPNDICRRLAEGFGGQSEPLYAPAYAESRAVRDAFLAHDQIRRTLDRARGAQIAVVGIGDADDASAVVRMGCFSVEDMRQLRAGGAVGDILGYFFDVHGQAVTQGIHDRVVGLGPGDLRRIPCVIGIASESDKTLAILGALRSGLVHVLATTLNNARRILELAGGKDTP